MAVSWALRFVLETAIMAFLKTRKDHPTADTVYQEIRNIIPNISLGTVYRNLSLLSDRGEILRLP